MRKQLLLLALGIGAAVYAQTPTDNWHFGTFSLYYWNSDTQAWPDEPFCVYNYTYYEDGKTKSENYNNGLSQEYTYDEKGRISRLTTTRDGVVTNADYEYDSVLEDFIIKTETCSDGSTINGTGKEIIRDENGNITKITEYSYERNVGEEQFAYTSYRCQLSIEYGADGKATSIAYKSGYNGHEFEYEEFRLSEIEWENTDGQIYLPNSFYYTSVYKNNDLIELFCKGNNRIKSAKYSARWRDTADVTVTYDGDSYHYLIVTETGMPHSDVQYTPTDEYGSYETKSTLSEFGWDSDDKQYVKFTYDVTKEEKFDPAGFQLERLETRINHYEEADETLTYGIKGYPTYDPEHGYITEMIYTEKRTDSDEYVNYQRGFYSDYVNCTSGVGNVAVDSNAPVEYYNLQGIRVDRPANGIYIRRQGNTTAKVIMK